jgi:hypothetical protein
MTYRQRRDEGAVVICQRCGGAVDPYSWRCQRCDTQHPDAPTVTPYYPPPPPPPSDQTIVRLAAPGYQIGPTADTVMRAKPVTVAPQPSPQRNESVLKWVGICVASILVVGAGFLGGIRLFHKSSGSTKTAGSADSAGTDRTIQDQPLLTTSKKSSSSPATTSAALVELTKTTAGFSIPIATPAHVITAAPTAAPSAPAIVPPTLAAPIVTAPTAPLVTIAAVLSPPVGSSLALNNPFPSGLGWDAVAGSFATAQRLADALAAHDWPTARQLQGTTTSDAQLSAGYKDLDRSTLMAIDARSEGDGYRFLVVSVANEKGGAQTSLWCLQWTANSSAHTVHQNKGGHKLVTLQGTVTAEQLLADSTWASSMRAQCGR